METRLNNRIKVLRARIETEFGVDVPVRVYDEHEVIKLRLARTVTANGWTAEYVQCTSYQYNPRVKRPIRDDARFVVVTEGLYAIVFLNRAEAIPDKSLRNVQLPRELVDIHVKRGFNAALILKNIKAALG